MRPIDKGKVPLDETGNAVLFKRYAEARPYLIDRLGELCSYCEMHLDSGLEVEHIQPKSLAPEKMCDWDNLLLACKNCNTAKGNIDINDSNMDDYLWPNLHNTFLAIVYREGGIVDVNPQLDEKIRQRARNLIKLVGLDKLMDNNTDSDRRWRNRREAWDGAVRAKKRLSVCDSLDMRKQIVDQVDGYFSIWMSVFTDDADMCCRLIRKFKGTCTSCFDCNGKPQIRDQRAGC